MNALLTQVEYLESLPAGHGCHSFVGRGMYAPLLRIWARHFVPHEELLVVTLEELKKKNGGAQRVMNKVFRFLGLPRHVLADTKPSNARSYAAADVADPALLSELKAFYAPHNRALDRVMNELGFDAPGY
jgi:hypothetical protein